MASAPSNDNVFYAGGHFTFAMAVTKTTDGGTNWTRYILPPMANFTKALAVDPTNANIVYAGGDSVLYKSTNGGTSWTSVFTGLRGAVTALAVSFRTASDVYAGTQYGLYKSTDAGLTWSNTGLSNVTSIAVDYTGPYYLYAGTSSGVYKSTNNGASWSVMNQGFLDSSITCLDIQSNQVLYAGTAAAGVNGWGLWGKITESTGGSRPIFRPTANPNRGRALITYSLPVGGRVRLVLYDNQGRLVRTLISTVQEAGNHSLTCRTDELAAGVYFLELVTPEAKTQLKLVVVK